MVLSDWIDSFQDAGVLTGFEVLLGIIVSTLGAILILIIKGRQERTKNNQQTAEALVKIKEVREHVANDHSSNLRVDLDEKFSTVLEKIDLHGKQVERRFDGLDNTVSQLRKDFEGERFRIRAVEDRHR